ncbi:MAG: Sec-independent protein translocase protein TatB [Acidimicrobiales bacterium]|nr:Sec-independent protein translocase protein TatB [Acidimicrobiales bacterium]
MFNVGGMELLVIALVALIFLGPDKLPSAIRQVGQVAGELRRMSQGFQTDLRGALDDAEREADAERRANDAAPPSSTPDPGAARAAAHAELEAAEAALEAGDTSENGVGAEASGESTSSNDDDSTAAAS